MITGENVYQPVLICNCWWCEDEGVKNYYNELCFNCTQKIASTILPGVLGQGKFDRHRVYWDKLKTLVTEKRVPPSERLLKAYMKTENTTASTVNATDVDKALVILERWGQHATPSCPPSPSKVGKENDAPSTLQSVAAMSQASVKSGIPKPPKSQASSRRNIDKVISNPISMMVQQVERHQKRLRGTVGKDHTLSAFEMEFAKLQALSMRNKGGSFVGAGTKAFGRAARVGSMDGFFRNYDSSAVPERRLTKNAILLKQNSIKNQHIPVGINDVKKAGFQYEAAGSFPPIKNVRAASHNVKQVNAGAMTVETKYSKFY